MNTVSGYYVSVTTIGEKCKAFVPNHLPSLNNLNITFELREKLDQALGFFLGLIEGFLLIVILVFLLKAQPVFSVEHLMENSFAASIADKIIPLGTRIIEEGIQA